MPLKRKIYFVGKIDKNKVLQNGCTNLKTTVLFSINNLFLRFSAVCMTKTACRKTKTHCTT